ncbi:RNA polymerase factor sigma-54 [Ammoniphilus oxalaticus]|nr:RNA polymerase factor sigma-54 [Ammoniphilus oxalaticus]
MGYGFFQEQSMKLAMTAELRQAIAILQLSAADLVDFIHQQMNENPALEPIHIELTSREDLSEHLSETNFEWSDYIRARAQGDYSASAVRSIDNEFDPLERVADQTQSLESELLGQLAGIQSLDARLQTVCACLVGNLDEKGYLDLTVEQLAVACQVELKEARKALGIVQSLEPHGIGARNLKECLMIQLSVKGMGESLAYQIVKNHIQALADGKMQQIATSLKVSLQQVQAAIDQIRDLDPRPGLRYERFISHYIIPDVFVDRAANEWIISVNDRFAAHLKISENYRTISRQEQEVRHYMREKLRDARWLIKSIEQRNLTLYRVTEAIVHTQRSFFEKGVAFLKPMTLKEIAEVIGAHESTVSRATDHKYAQTPRGIFPLKYFFSSGVSTIRGEMTSSESVKAKLSAWIKKEDGSRPLSDQKLSDRLNAEGISISRRTVAKYREQLGILPSAKRKRYR